MSAPRYCFAVILLVSLFGLMVGCSESQDVSSETVVCIEPQEAEHSCSDHSEVKKVPVVREDRTNRKIERPSVSDKYTRVIRVNSSKQLIEALTQLAPGDAVVLKDGVYTTGGVEISGIQATAENPVLIKAQNIGGVQWKGYLHIYNSAHISVEGIVFDESLAKFPASEAKVVRVHLKSCHHCRISRCILEFDESGISKEESRYWLFLEAGRFNEVDHCVFNDKKTKYAPLKIVYNEFAPFIHHNYFPLHSSGGGNGYETLQMGQGATGTHGRKMHAIVEYNLFVNCDGEGEIISAKTSANTIRFNTFIGCKGKVVLRMADDSMVYNNYFLNPEGKAGVGGIRIHGSRNKVYNNYFEGLTAPVFETWPGDTDTTQGGEERGYRQSKDNLLFFNTAYDCKSHILYFRPPTQTAPLPSKDWKIMNNLFVFSAASMVGGAGEEQNFIYESNVAYSPNRSVDLGRDFSPDQFRVINPLLVQNEDGIWRQQSISPTIGTASPVPSPAHGCDLDGQARDPFFPDIGADEQMESTVFNQPLSPEQVGPFAPLPILGKLNNHP